VTDDLTWGALDDDSFDELRTLAQASLEADGGMPLFTGEQMLPGRMLIGESIAAHDASGALVAAASLSLGESGATTTGMVHPARRGEGLGTRLLQWAHHRAGHTPLTVVTETLSERAERLYARFGLAEVFAEDVMHHDLSGVPDLPAPEGITLSPASAADHTLLATDVDQPVGHADRLSVGHQAPRKISIPIRARLSESPSAVTRSTETSWSIDNLC